MIIIVQPSGNHSNRLFQSIHFEAFAIENGLRYYNPTFNNLNTIYGLKARWFDKIFLKLFRRFNKFFKLKICEFSVEYFNQQEPTFCDLKKEIAFVAGWFFFQNQLTMKYKTYFREKYTISDSNLDVVLKDEKCNYKQIIVEIAKSEIVYGIHIRRGDYKEWEDGRFYYENTVYQNAMNQSSVLFGDKRVLFLIFSNECIAFDLPNNTIISNNEWYVDHHLMGKCDYLIGPPSTFTLWASYIGPKAKYYHINHNNDFPLTLSSFKEYNG